MLEKSPKKPINLGYTVSLEIASPRKVVWVWGYCGSHTQRGNWGYHLKPLESLQGLVLQCAGVWGGILPGKHRLCSFFPGQSHGSMKKLNVNQRRNLISEDHLNGQIEMSHLYRLTQHLVLAC